MYMLFTRISTRLRLIGKAPLCNRRRERAPVVFGFCSPLCYRCLGLVTGYLVVTFMPRNLIWILPNEAAIFGLIFMPTDWLLQRLNFIPSTNARRFVSGLIFVWAMSQFSSCISTDWATTRAWNCGLNTNGSTPAIGVESKNQIQPFRENEIRIIECPK
jgi:uncharacterized membrane protein